MTSCPPLLSLSNSQCNLGFPVACTFNSSVGGTKTKELSTNFSKEVTLTNPPLTLLLLLLLLFLWREQLNSNECMTSNIKTQKRKGETFLLLLLLPIFFNEKSWVYRHMRVNHPCNLKTFLVDHWPPHQLYKKSLRPTKRDLSHHCSFGPLLCVDLMP